MGAERVWVFFFFKGGGLVEAHWDNCKCVFMAKNVNQSGTTVEVTVTFVSGGVKWEGGGVQTDY